jgi:hypothetical protein
VLIAAFDPGMEVAIHLCRPLQETPQAGSLGPQEIPEFQEPDLRHFDSGVGFDAPQQIGTAPRGDPVATSGVPKKAEHRPHQVQYSARGAKKNEEWDGASPSHGTRKPYLVMTTLARVLSHSMRSVHLLPPWSNAIRKFSTGVLVFETFIGTRTKSSFSPG